LGRGIGIQVCISGAIDISILTGANPNHVLLKFRVINKEVDEGLSVVDDASRIDTPFNDSIYISAGAMYQNQGQDSTPVQPPPPPPVTPTTPLTSKSYPFLPHTLSPMSGCRPPSY
jgi:hypothetical protein